MTHTILQTVAPCGQAPCGDSKGHVDWLLCNLRPPFQYPVLTSPVFDLICHSVISSVLVSAPCMFGSPRPLLIWRGCFCGEMWPPSAVVHHISKRDLWIPCSACVECLRVSTIVVRWRRMSLLIIWRAQTAIGQVLTPHCAQDTEGSSRKREFRAKPACIDRS